MPFFQFNTIICRVLIGCLVLTLSLAPGCVSQKTENVKTMEEQSDSMQKDSPVQPDSQMNDKTVIQSVDIQQQGQHTEVLIKGNHEIKGYTSIKQAFPFGVAVYLSGVRIDPKMNLDFEADEVVQDLKVEYADLEQTTAKVEITLKRDIPYEVKEEAKVLRLTFFKRQAGTSRQVTINHDSAETKMLQVDSGSGSEISIPDTIARLTDIRFDTSGSGQSDIIVETSHPVKYDLISKGPKTYDLNLYNTIIPAYHQRPLKTLYFNSAVEKIFPKAGKGNDSVIEIRVRDQVPYRILRDQNFITLAFEPSVVKPPLFSKANMVLNPKASEQTTTTNNTETIKKVEANQSEANDNDMLIEDIDTLTGARDKKYVGEKIKLEFFDTDIRNVFRILKSVSGMNFAIDSDVQGRVTLSLDQPVAWDQVMDLVLKMNQLGKKREGNVYRIATLATIKAEEEALQAAIKARKESMEQKKALEAMITEYIPIAYGEAEPYVCHIAPVMSESDDDNAVQIKCNNSTFKLRGSISADARTNMIVITDTKEKIRQAYAIINELDKVTPQIMIEAKVVEVTKNFSRSLGIGWNLSNSSAVTSGFIDDYNISVNSPSGSGLSGGFSFFRLFGSSVNALNAKLEASEEKGDVKIVSSPRILTLDNKKARIKQGTEYAYLERDDAGGSSVKFKDIDLLLEVTPHVTPDKRISMTVKLTKNDIAGVTTTGAPTLATNEAETELLVDNQDTVVIGGIVKTTKSKDKKGVPFLTGIPILGQLFGTTSKEDDRNELLIFMTPSIVQLEQKRLKATDQAKGAFEQ